MTDQSVKSNCLNLAFISKISLGNPNSSYTEDNVIIAKKVTLPNGEELPYISGQSIRRYIRDKWIEGGVPISLVNQQNVGGKKIAASQCDPSKFVDDDLFGFMMAAPDRNMKRTAPVRISPAIGLFKFRDDRDLGTRMTEEGKQDPTKLMPPFETEVYFNYFRWNMLIEVDRLGVFDGDTYSGQQRPGNLTRAQKQQRVEHLLVGVRDLWGGGKQSRMLTDVSPKFVIYTRQSSKKPIFLESLQMTDRDEGTGREAVDRTSIEATLTNNRKIIQKVTIGVDKSAFPQPSTQDKGQFEFKWRKKEKKTENGKQIEVPEESTIAKELFDAFNEIIEDAKDIIQ